MPVPFDYKLGPFGKGLNTAIESHLLAPDEASDNLNVDYTRGSLKGLYGPGTSIASVTSGSKFTAWLGNAVWVATSQLDCSLNDAPTQAGVYVSYRTQRTSATAANNPLIYQGSTSGRLGIVAPTSAPSVAAFQAGGDSTNHRQWAYTFVTSDGLESNPSPIYTNSVDNAPRLTLAVSSDSRVTKRRVYGTVLGDSTSGDLYYVGELANNTATAYPSSSTYAVDTPDLTRPLNWGAGGNFLNAAMPEDHSPAPNLVVLSDSIHAVTEGTGAPGAGILFGAIGNAVYWSMLGYASYWPTVNTLALPETIQALTTHRTQTIALTDSALYAFIGTSDSNVSSAKVSDIGVVAGAGKTAKTTPFGLLYRATEGIALWNGNESTIISRGILKAKDLLDGGYTHAAYWDQRYYLFGTANTLIFDLTAFPTLRVTKANVIASASHVTPYAPTSGAQGLYVVVSGAVKPWRPTEETSVSGSTRQAWSHATGLLTADEPGRLKRFNRVHPKGSGAVTFSFYKDSDSSPFYTKAVSNLATVSDFRLPARFGRGLKVVMASSDGTGQVDEVRIEAEAC